MATSGMAARCWPPPTARTTRSGCNCRTTARNWTCAATSACRCWDVRKRGFASRIEPKSNPSPSGRGAGVRVRARMECRRIAEPSPALRAPSPEGRGVLRSQSPRKQLPSDERRFSCRTVRNKVAQIRSTAEGKSDACKFRLDSARLRGRSARSAVGNDPWRESADKYRCSGACTASVGRDDWGIPHVHGRTDADAVFGMIYAQAEDDFKRVEMNYLTALGWTAEAEGESAIWQDLRQKLWVDQEQPKKLYAQSPDWLKQLMDAWADGLNWYLATHPEVHPKVITRFEPWMALSFTEGSIGGDIERVDLPDLAKFYGADPATTIALAQTPPSSWAEPTGSNGIAIAPKLSADGHALLLINPHVTFYFRSESQMSSDQGLDAYGASTWGQF